MLKSIQQFSKLFYKKFKIWKAKIGIIKSITMSLLFDIKTTIWLNLFVIINNELLWLVSYKVTC